jgi:zinc transport system substrate-binding protein
MLQFLLQLLEAPAGAWRAGSGSCGDRGGASGLPASLRAGGPRRGTRSIVPRAGRPRYAAHGIASAFAAGLLILAACGQEKAPPPDGAGTEKIRVAVSILPQVEFVERVGGEYVKVEALVGPGQSPETYNPAPRKIAGLAHSRVYFRIGVPFEKTLLRKLEALFPDLRVVDTQKNVERVALESHERSDSDPAPAAPREGESADAGPERKSGRPAEGGGRDREEGELDPHTWLDPQLVKIQARTICETLAAIDPAHAPRYEKNLRAFQEDLDRVHEKIARALAPLRGREFYVFHPAFGYFARAYGLKQAPIESGGKEPSPRQVARIIARAQESGVKVIFVQPQFSKRSAERIARAIGGAVVTMDPLARDYLANLERMAGEVAAALAGGGPGMAGDRR